MNHHSVYPHVGEIAKTFNAGSAGIPARQSVREHASKLLLNTNLNFSATSFSRSALKAGKCARAPGFRFAHSDAQAHNQSEKKLNNLNEGITRPMTEHRHTNRLA